MDLAPAMGGIPKMHRLSRLLLFFKENSELSVFFQCNVGGIVDRMVLCETAISLVRGSYVSDACRAK